MNDWKNIVLIALTLSAYALLQGCWWGPSSEELDIMQAAHTAGCDGDDDCWIYEDSSLIGSSSIVIMTRWSHENKLIVRYHNKVERYIDGGDILRAVRHFQCTSKQPCNAGTKYSNGFYFDTDHPLDSVMDESYIMYLQIIKGNQVLTTGAGVGVQAFE